MMAVRGAPKAGISTGRVARSEAAARGTKGVAPPKDGVVVVMMVLVVLVVPHAC